MIIYNASSRFKSDLTLMSDPAKEADLVSLRGIRKPSKLRTFYREIPKR